MGSNLLLHRYAAAIPIVGVSNLVSKVGTTDIQEEMYHVHYGFWPWDKWDEVLLKPHLLRQPIAHPDLDSPRKQGSESGFRSSEGTSIITCVFVEKHRFASCIQERVMGMQRLRVAMMQPSVCCGGLTTFSSKANERLLRWI